MEASSIASSSSSNPSTSTSLPSSSTAAVDANAFSQDPRVHVNTLTGKWTFEQEDGSELEWDIVRGAWVPVLDDSLLSIQQAAYSVEGVDESAPVAAVLAREEAKKRKQDDPTSTTNKKAKRPPRVQKQTAIFITKLPPSTTVKQIAEAFVKAGVILENSDGDPKIKLYYEEDGRFKGEALLIYLKEESVDLAIRLLDETELVPGAGEGEMVVKKAEWEKKEKPVIVAAEGSKADAAKKKAGRRVERQQKKLADWSSDDEDAATIAAKEKNKRVVVLAGMFTLQELEEDPTLLLDLKEEVRDECETMGEVTAVTLYDKEEDGILTVRFKDEASAQACIAKNNNRFFGGRSISAFLFDGSKRYRKSGQGVSLEGTGFGGEVGADAAEKEKERLDKYAEWLEKDGKA